MDLSIIIVSWNTRDKLKNNLNHLFKSETDFSFEVFVVDNNSTDGSVEMVKNNFSQVKLIVNRENFGFAKANNQAIKESIGDFVLLLNPDMQIFPDTLDNMVFWMKKNSKAGVAGCSLVDENDDIIKQVRRFPRISDQLAIVLKLPHVFPSILDGYIIADFDYGKESQVDSIRGGFFMIRRSLFERILSKERLSKGEFLDERYFLWFEEVDFCKTVKEKGGEVWYTPSARCIDFIGQSFKQLSRSSTQEYFKNSQLAYFKKWHPTWQYFLLKIFWPIGMFLAWIFSSFGLKSKKNT